MDVNAASEISVLLLCPAVAAWRFGEVLLLDRKFHDGLKMYVANWPGRIRLAMRIKEIDCAPPFGSVEIGSDELGVDFIWLENNDSLQVHHLVGASVALVAADNHKNLHIAALCRELGVPCIHDIEYTLRTRRQMIWQGQASLRKKLGSLVWVTLNELKLRKAISQGVSIQANGLPAFLKYGQSLRAPLLYLDNRMTEALCISRADFDSKIEYLTAGNPLRLAFSGRLIAAKGADAFPELARVLKGMGIPFELHIFGAGDLSEFLERRVRDGGLQDVVHLHGAVDFERELIPFLKSNIDLFVCCHRQGDPSCTYIETNGCGVPIVGYDNEAQRAFVREFDVGWVVPMDDVQALAQKIASLHADRLRIAQKARAALSLAQQHVFSGEFQRRMAHCKEMVAVR